MSNRSRANSLFFLKFAFAGAAAAALGYGVLRVLVNNDLKRSIQKAVPLKLRGSFGSDSFRKELSRSHHLKPVEIQAASARVGVSHARVSKKEIFAHQTSKDKVKWIPGLRVREQKIIDMMPKRKPVRMSSFVHHFKNVTERTLRRDLDRLVRKGRVKRVGTTRATTYVKL